MHKKQKIIFISAISIIILVVFGIMTFRELKTGDFIYHLNWAKEFSSNGYIIGISHSLFGRLVSIIRAFIPANILVLISPWLKHVWDLKSFDLSALILLVTGFLATAWLMISRLLKTSDNRGWNNKHSWLIGGICISLLLVGPITFFTLADRVYLGYITGNAYHNPTYLLLRPFAVLLFFIIVDNFYVKWRWTTAIMACAAIIFATFSKPNFTLSILPALAIVCAINFQKWKQINKWLIVSIAFVGILILGWQFWVSFLGQTGDQIQIAPFRAILIHVPSIPLELLFTVLSIAFPLTLTLIYWKEVWRQTTFQIAWINFLVGLSTAFFLAEKTKIAHLNFWWGPMIGLFLLFYTTVEFWVRKNLQDGYMYKNHKAVNISLFFLFASHLICGIIYYFMVLLHPGLYIVV